MPHPKRTPSAGVGTARALFMGVDGSRVGGEGVQPPSPPPSGGAEVLGTAKAPKKIFSPH